jgi:ammonia channel protein AmtB
MLSHSRRQQSSELIPFFQLLAYRMAGAAIIILWTSVASCIMFGILKCAGKLRVSAKDEQEGKKDTASNMDTLFLTFSATYTQKCTSMSVSGHATVRNTHSH